MIINVCREPLHYHEFVRPIVDITGDKVFHYRDLKKPDGRIIICGNGLQDNDLDYSGFEWLKTYNEPVLGICAGFQIIAKVFGGKLHKGCEIGFFEEEFRDFLGLKGKHKVYHLHNYYAEFPGEFEVFAASKYPEAVKHKVKPVYGVLFHPEVRQKDMIKNFLKI